MASPQRQSLLPDDLTGACIGRFAVTAFLGGGGMGQVYRADDTRLKRPVALKRLAPELRNDQQYRQRFLHEGERACAVEHPHIAGIYDVFEQEGELFLVMEYVEGATLRTRLGKAMPLEAFQEIALQCAEALAAAHEKGIVHCDIKPENIMLTAEGRVKVLDFGVAKRLPLVADVESTTRSVDPRGTLGGTPSYMSPEVLLGREPNAGADIFSLGIVFYEMLTGRHPFLSSSTMVTANRILHDAAPRVSSVNPATPPGLDRIIDSMLAKDPKQRYGSAQELLAGLRAVGEPRPASAWRTPPLMTMLVVLALAIPVLWVYLARGPAGPRGMASNHRYLAVLPFRAIGGQAEDKAYCDGLTQTLTAKLTLLTTGHALLVAPASEIWARQLTTVEMARKELGVDFVLAGSCHGTGDAMRINYEMIDAGSRRKLQAGTTTPPLSDVFAEDQVVDGVLSMLDVELRPGERDALAVAGTKSPAARELYLRGRGYLQEHDNPESVGKAIEVLTRAATLDPSYASPHAALGEAYWRTHDFTKNLELVERGKQECERALKLDPKLAEAHICLGTIYRGTGGHERAAREFSQAVELQPSNDDAYRGLGQTYIQLGRWADAERAYRQAIQLRPSYWAGYSRLAHLYFLQGRYEEAAEQLKLAVAAAPLNARPHMGLGGAYIELGKFEDAIQSLKKAIAIRPVPGAYSNLGVAYLALRQYDDAISSFQRACAISQFYVHCGNLARAYYWAPGKRAQAAREYQHAVKLAGDRLQVNPKDAEAHISLATFYAMQGKRTDAHRHLGEALTEQPNPPEFLFWAAVVHNQLGQRDAALTWLEKAVAAGYSTAGIRAAPEFDGLHADKRFQALLDRKPNPGN